MRLYKYRGLKGDDFRFALDSIINQRIRLTTEQEVNDPHEGGFVPLGDPMDFSEIHFRMKKARFSCFTDSAENPLLWAHYAGGYSGICVVYDLDESSEDYDLRRMTYGKNPEISKADCDSILSGKTKMYDHRVLLSKKKDWAYEGEWRLFDKRPNVDPDDRFIRLTPYAVILGSREDSLLLQLLSALEVKTGHLIGFDGGYEIYYP